MPTYPPTTTPLTSAAPVTCSLVDAIPVPTHGPGGSFSVLAKAQIAAPPALVLKTIRNTSEWCKWNSFCPRCVVEKVEKVEKVEGEESVRDEALETGKEGWLEVGMCVVIDVFMDGDGLVEGKKKSRDQGIEMTILERLEDGRSGYVIAWKSTGFSHWQMHSERVMEMVETDGGTEYTCWETFGGLAGKVVKVMVGSQLVERFGDYARDVKEFAEGSKQLGT